MDVIAEGVETADQLAKLVELGCDMAQGYLISKPLPADLVPAWIRQHTHGQHTQVLVDASSSRH
jgi:EAL domain-containing protein (putative c-di-GMP-specific phosphodiesterase class I)